MSQLSLKKIKLGDNADLSKNFVISVPAVADGTLTIERENGTDVLTIDANGNIRAGAGGNLVGNGPAFSAVISANQEVSQLVFTKVVFDSEEFDTNANFDTSLGRFAPTVAGYYQVDASINWKAGVAGSRLITLYKNGVRHRDGLNTSSSITLGCPLSVLVYMNGTTDYLEIFAYCAGPASLAVVAFAPGTYFQGHLVRAA